MRPDAVTAGATTTATDGRRGADVERKLSAGFDYLVRTDPPRVPAGVAEFAAADRRVFRIDGIGRDEKFGAALERNAAQPGDTFTLPTVGLLTGLHEFGSPLAFVVTGSEGRVSLDIGVWTARSDLPATQLTARAEVLGAVLRSVYPAVALRPSRPSDPIGGESAAVLGVPTVIPPTLSDPVAPIDRVIRSLSTDSYQILVLAQPLTAQRIGDLRDEVISEMRWVQVAAHAESLPSPLATDYLELLKKQLETLTEAERTGAWRTAVYLCAPPAGLARLESVWRSTFSGPKSLPEPVRVHRMAAASGWAARWALPELAGSAGSTYLRRPFEVQTVLTSELLAAYVHLPEQEAPGFAVDAIARFDSVVATPATRPNGTPSEPAVVLGRVVHAERVTGQDMVVPLDALTKHILVCGVTGSGKSTTTRHLLTELAGRGVPFLVVEPAKAEYRQLAGLAELSGRLRVFTVGDESVAPVRLNPLAAVPGSSVATHVDLLKSLFSASFGLWAPLPQILERCLHELYADYGWDLVTDTNRRLRDIGAWDQAFPTLTELHETVDRYIGALGYQGEVTANMRAALSTRIAGLTVGGKGAALDTRRCTAAEHLFDATVVLELERLADPDDQAFVIGLLMIHLLEYRRARGPSPRLKHLLVIEEAHRLLARVEASETGNPRAKAVETFANLLAEIRSYGQGVLVADQVPVKLAPEIIKNTNLKIAHRLVADDDRAALAASMVMNERQHRALATLGPGRAAVFAEGQDAPVLLAMAANAGLPPIDDDWLRVPVSGESNCDASCGGPFAGPGGGRIGSPALPDTLHAALARVAQSLLADPGAAARLRSDLELEIRMCPAVAGHGISCVLRRLAQAWAVRRGRQYGWPFDATAAIGTSLADTLTAAHADAGSFFAATVVAACARRVEVFPRCAVICPSGACLHRHAAAAALATDPGAPMVGAVDEPARRVWERAAERAVDIVEFPAETMDDPTWSRVQPHAVTASLCLAQQAIVSATQLSSSSRIRLLDEVIALAPRGVRRRPVSPSPGVSR